MTWHRLCVKKKVISKKKRMCESKTGKTEKVPSVEGTDLIREHDCDCCRFQTEIDVGLCSNCMLRSRHSGISENGNCLSCINLAFRNKKWLHEMQKITDNLNDGKKIERVQKLWNGKRKCMY